MKDQIKLAMEIAAKAHEGQFRWDGKTPYISHPAAIALAIGKPYQDTGMTQLVKDMVAAAWLHDVVEDTPLTIADLRVAGISETVLSAVELLTKRDGEDYLTYLLRLKSDPIALKVKVEDIKHNMSTLDKKKKKSMYEKYQLALYILAG